MQEGAQSPYKCLCLQACISKSRLFSFWWKLKSWQFLQQLIAHLIEKFVFC